MADLQKIRGVSTRTPGQTMYRGIMSPDSFKNAAATALLTCIALPAPCMAAKETPEKPTRFAVRDFGAIPDDAQPDGEAIRKCIAAAQASGKPTEVVFEAGIYHVEPGPAASGELFGLPVKGAKNLSLRGA